jgi:hypothetical protein
MKPTGIDRFFVMFWVIQILTLMPLATAQDSAKKGHIRGALGYSKIYLDEPGGLLVAGSVLVVLTQHWGIEPEVIWIDSDRFEEKGFAVSCVYDFGEPDQSVKPYLIGGLGYLSEFDKAINYQQGNLTFHGGGGVRMRLYKRLFVAPEARLGSKEARLAVGLGYEF